MYAEFATICFFPVGIEVHNHRILPAVVAPELIQKDCNGTALAYEIGLRLDDPELCARQIDGQNRALLKMGRGGPDPDEAAANAVLALIGR